MVVEVFFDVLLGEDVVVEGFVRVWIPGCLEVMFFEFLVVLDGVHN